MRVFVLALFLLSGACGLIYEVIWARVMTQILGSTVLAVGTVLAAFMSGMALGSYLLGRLGDRSRNPLRLYAVYEIGIGLAALASQMMMDRTAGLYAWMQSGLGDGGPLLPAARFLFAFALVLLPTCLMGATLPILARFVITRVSAVGSGLSTLYAINTLGAVAGALAAGFHLIPTLGIHGSVYLAVAGNFLIGVLALVASRRAAEPEDRGEPNPESVDEGAHGKPAEYSLLLWGFGLSGFASFAYEIFWTRSLVHLLGNSTYAFTLMLTAFLAGIALGGYAVRFLVRRIGNPIAWFGGLQLAIGISAAAVLPMLFFVVESPAWRGLIEQTSGQMGALMLSRFLAALTIMLIPATLIGATFPLVGSIFVRDLRLTGADVGRVYAVNTLGNVFGALAPGFILLPWFGIQKGILLVAALNISIGLFFLLAHFPRLRALRPAVPAGFLLVATLLPGWTLGFQFPSEFQQPGDRVLYYREGLAGTTKVFEDRDTGAKRMSIDGIVIGGTEFTDYKQQVLAHLPKLLVRQPRTELSIGLGSGILIGESLRHRSLESVVCLEIEPSVIEGAGSFAAENHGVLEDSRARIVMDDIANFLRTTSDRYDIISADEKTADNYASNGFSFSTDYYDLLREHLTERGVVIQWVANQLPASQYRMVLQTFASSFPATALFYLPSVGKGGPVNTFLVGSRVPLSLDPSWMNQELVRKADRFQGLYRYGLDSAEAILAHYVAEADTLREVTAGVSRNSLEHPLYEFYSPTEYAVPLNLRVLQNHRFLVPLRQAHGPLELARDFPGGASPGLVEATRAESEFLEGLGLQLSGAPHAAIDARYQAALSLAPWNLNLRSQILTYFWNTAGVQYIRGDLPGALQLMARAVAIEPGLGEVHYYHGMMLVQAGATDAGVAELRLAVERSPRLLPPRRLLASLASQSSMTSGAPGSAGAPESLAMDEAFAQLEGILAIDPQDLYALVNYANLLAEVRSDPDAARVYLTRAAELAPRDPSVIDARAWIAFLEGDRQAALQIVTAGGGYYLGSPLYERRRARILE